MINDAYVGDFELIAPDAFNDIIESDIYGLDNCGDTGDSRGGDGVRPVAAGGPADDSPTNNSPSGNNNYCPDCKIPAFAVMGCDEYQCGECGLVMRAEAPAGNHADTTNSNIRIGVGAKRGRWYNVTSDYVHTQRKCIETQLSRNQHSYTGNAFPQNVLSAAASHYNTIQRHITEDDVDDAGAVVGQKKFVRRGNIKDEVLAGLIYYECIREGLVRKKRDIAIFMNLPTHGFARGEDILRNMHAEGQLDIPIDEEPIEGFIDRYLEALNLPAEHSKFIVELVNESERRRIGMGSQMSSKVVGALWLVIVRLRLGVTDKELERAADNTKKNTFIKFYKAVLANISLFAPIFQRHNIPL